MTLDKPVQRLAQSEARPVPWYLKLRQGCVVTRHSSPGVHKTQGPPRAAQLHSPPSGPRPRLSGDASIPTTTGGSMIRTSRPAQLWDSYSFRHSTDAGRDTGCPRFPVEGPTAQAQGRAARSSGAAAA